MFFEEVREEHLIQPTFCYGSPDRDLAVDQEPPPTMKSLDADKKASKTSEAAPAEAEKQLRRLIFPK